MPAKEPNLRTFAFILSLTVACAWLSGGCPQDASTAGTPSAEAEATDTTGADATDGTPPPSSAGDPPPGLGTLVVETVSGAANTEYDVYELPGGESSRSYESTNTPIYLAPGVYYVTQYFNEAFKYAATLTITASSTTTITLGAIELVAVTGASDGYFDIYDALGAVEYSSYNAPNAIITAPAGTFTLKEYFNASFDYATNVTVVAGETTTVEMGGIKLVTAANADDGQYGIYDSSGATVYATYNDPDIIITAPPGTFTLKEYFNDKFTYASNVQVVAGETTEVEMGGIRYNGSQAYDIYVSGVLVSSYNEPEKVITAPAGTYTLMKYFDDETVLEPNVIVTAGAVTTVP